MSYNNAIVFSIYSRSVSYSRYIAHVPPPPPPPPPPHTHTHTHTSREVGGGDDGVIIKERKQGNRQSTAFVFVFRTTLFSSCISSLNKNLAVTKSSGTWWMKLTRIRGFWSQTTRPGAVPSED